MNNAASSSNFEKVKSGEEKVNQMAKVPDDGTLGKNSTTEGPASFFGSTRYYLETIVILFKACLLNLTFHKGSRSKGLKQNSTA